MLAQVRDRNTVCVWRGEKRHWHSSLAISLMWWLTRAAGQQGSNLLTRVTLSPISPLTISLLIFHCQPSSLFHFCHDTRAGNSDQVLERITQVSCSISINPPFWYHTYHTYINVSRHSTHCTTLCNQCINLVKLDFTQNLFIFVPVSLLTQNSVYVCLCFVSYVGELLFC